MAIIFSDDINDQRGADLSKRVDTLYDYITYMKEQLEFWARNRTREISDADKKIATANENIAENADAIADLEPRIQAYENDIELGNTITVGKPTMFDDGIQPKDSDGVTGVEVLPTRTTDRLGGRIKLDRGESTARDAYIDTFESKLRFVDRNPSTAVRASLDLSTGEFNAASISDSDGTLYAILRTSMSISPNQYGAANTGLPYTSYRIISVSTPTSNADNSAILVPFVAWGNWWVRATNWITNALITSGTYTIDIDYTKL